MRIKEFSNNVSLKTNTISHNEYISGLFDTAKAQDSFESIRLSQVSFCGFFEKMSLKNEAVSQRRNAQKVFSQSKEIKANADKAILQSHYVLSDSRIALRHAYKALPKVMDLVNNAKENNIVYDLDSQSEGIVRRFKKDADRFIMDELVKGICTRKVVIEEDKIHLIEYGEQDKQNIFIFDAKTQKLLQYMEGAKMSPVGCKAQKSFVFDDDSLVSCDFDLISRYGEFDKSKEHFAYVNNKMTDCIFGFEKDSSGLKKYEKHYNYFGNSLNYYVENYKSITGVCDTCEEKYVFGGSSGLKKYSSNNIEVFGGNETSDAYYLFEGVNPKVICIENLVTSDGHRQYGKMFEYHTAKSAKPKSYYQDYKITDKLIKSYNRKIEL